VSLSWSYKLQVLIKEKVLFFHTMNALVFCLENAVWLLSHSSSQLFMCQATEAGALITWPRPRCAFAWAGTLTTRPSVLLHEQVHEKKQNTFCKCSLVIQLNFCVMSVLDHVSPLLTRYSVCMWTIYAHTGAM